MGKSSIGLPACLAGIKAGCVQLYLVAGNIAWSYTASDTP